MAYIVHKIVDDGNEWLPDITETPIWVDFENADAPKPVRLAAVLYMAVEKRENYFQNNTPTAFGNPEYNYACGVVHGILQAAEIEEREDGGKLVFYKGNRTILVVDKPKLPESFHNARRENAKTLRAFGF